MGDIADLYGGAPVPTDQEDAATGDFTPIPAGWYPAQVESAEVKDNRKQNGKVLKLVLDIVGENYAGRKLFPNINLVNPSQKAVEIGMRDLAALGQACGLAHLNDTSELVGKIIDVRVKVEAATKDYDADNKVTAWAPVGTKTGGSQAPARHTAAPASAPAPAAAPATAPAPAAKRPWER